MNKLYFTRVVETVRERERERERGAFPKHLNLSKTTSLIHTSYYLQQLHCLTSQSFDCSQIKLKLYHSTQSMMLAK